MEKPAENDVKNILFPLHPTNNEQRRVLVHCYGDRMADRFKWLVVELTGSSMLVVEELAGDALVRFNNLKRWVDLKLDSSIIPGYGVVVDWQWREQLIIHGVVAEAAE